MAHVQQVNTGASYQAGGASSFSLVFGSVITSGNAVTGIVSFDDTATLNSITDDKSNTYTVLDSFDDTGNQQTTASFVLGNITNAPKTITFNFSSGVSFGFAAADEYSGVLASSNPTDGHTFQIQVTSSTLSSGNITTTTNGDLIWGGIANIGSAATGGAAGSGFTLRNSQLVGAFNNGVWTEDLTQTTAGSVAATFAGSGSAGFNWGTFVIALKPTGGGGGITGTLATTEAKDVAAIAGTVVNNGTLATTEAKDIAAFNGNIAATGTLVTTESPDISAINGTVVNVATLAVTEAQDTAAFAGTVVNNGVLSTTETQDIAAFSGSLNVFGTLATTEAQDTAALNGTVVNLGTLATTEALDIAAFSGNLNAFGTLATTEAQDILAFSGSVGNVITGTLATTEAQDTASFNGTVVNVGTLAVTEAQDTVAFSGNLNAFGTLVTTEAQDISAFLGSLNVFGPLATTEAQDILAFSGTVSLLSVSGTLATTEASDIALFMEGGIFGGRWHWIEGVQALKDKRPQLPTQSEQIRKAAAVLSKMGGHARAASLTPKQRSNIASTAAKARWR